MRLIITLLLSFILIGCAQKNEIIEQRNNTEVTSEEDLQRVINDLILNSKFSNQQKSQFDQLRTDLSENLKINAVINIKLRALLFKELLSTNYNKIEVQLIQEMVRRNNIERNSLLTETISIADMIADRKSAPDTIELLHREVYLLY